MPNLLKMRRILVVVFELNVPAEYQKNDLRKKVSMGING